MKATYKLFPVDGGWGFQIWIGPTAADMKPFPWDGRSWDTKAQAIAAAKQSPWLR